MRLGVSVSRFSPLVGPEADKIKFGEVLSGLIFAVFKLAWYSGWLWPGAAAAAPSAATATPHVLPGYRSRCLSVSSSSCCCRCCYFCCLVSLLCNFEFSSQLPSAALFLIFCVFFKPLRR